MRRSGGGRRTIAERLSAADSHPLGFDYLRLILALSVVGFHSFTTSHDVAADHFLWRSVWNAPLRMILPMFFALSGFLVAGSLIRSASLGDFLTRRVLRIVPALFAEILLSALVLGPLLTAVPLSHYFRDREFFTYFLNSVGDVHFSLPGVFLDNPRAGLVNGSLWTIPYEGLCYLALTCLAVLGAVRHRTLLLVIVAVVPIALTLKSIYDHEIIWAPTGPFLVACFLAGVALFRNRDRIPVGISLAAAAALTSLAMLSVDRLIYLAALPLAYFTICLGLTRLPRTFAVEGDYSYGVYLFAFPIQQACVQLAPGLRSTWAVFLIAAPLSLTYAAFSWHFIERPILSRKRQIAASVTHIVSRSGRRMPHLFARVQSSAHPSV